MADLASQDGARSMLEALSDNEPHAAFPNAAARIAAIEQARPQVKFTRHLDGSTIGFGMVPEQATGTIDGNPFYYRFRHDTATITVWPTHVGEETFDPSDMPTHNAEPVLIASIAAVTGNEYAGCLDDDLAVSTFVAAVDALHLPTYNDTYNLRVAAQHRQARVAPGGWVAVTLFEAFPTSSMIDLGPTMSRAGHGAVKLPSGVVVHAQTRTDTCGSRPDELTLQVSVPGAHPFSRGDYAMAAAVPVPPRMAERSITDGLDVLRKALPDAVTALDGRYLYETFTSNLPTPERHAHQEAAVAAYNEIVTHLGLPAMSTDRSKALTAMATEDRGDIMRRHFDS